MKTTLKTLSLHSLNSLLFVLSLIFPLQLSAQPVVILDCHEKCSIYYANAVFSCKKQCETIACYKTCATRCWLEGYPGCLRFCPLPLS